MNLKEKRLERGLTQKQVAKGAGIKAPTYNLIENGKRTTKPKTAMRIAEVLDINWTDFYTAEESDERISTEENKDGHPQA